ncbi:DcaP family trimeric outer membrane transporter [Anaeromyxobacter diazotrophicus]|uniref:Porin n=1 Tax=Anaeromyxobacter diazotrophicus TaxID=2590199 RepID=A0A7I9VMG3_9BACT|nr:DcaP family trimeric outer membrane transporter [Anaeromyxobacter diazotrophicus]GEJ57592.1 porin [Anaeromyxobacter diazotrophicus]
MTLKRIATLCLVVGMALPFAARADDAPGVFKIPGTDSTIKFYGYVQLDTTYDFAGRDPNVEGNDWAVHIANVPLENSAEYRQKKNQMYMTARTSRFGIETSTPTKIGAVGVKLEGDFNASNLESGQSFTNSVLFRLRHAYGTVAGASGTFLVGQTWSNFLDLASYPDTVDFNGPGSIALIRQPQIRYTLPIGPASLAVAVENAPGTDGDDFGNLGGGNGSRVSTIPDFTANLGFSGAWGSASIRGVTRNVKVVDNAAAPTKTLSKQGYGGAASAALKLGGDTLVVHGVYGSGLGRYIFNVGLSVGPNGMLVGANDLTAVEAAAYHVGYTHVWTPAVRSNLVWSQTFIMNPTIGGVDAFDNTVNHRMDQLFVNSFWTFAKNAEFGLEYGWGQRKTFNVGAGGEQTGTQSRITGTFHYNFF